MDLPVLSGLNAAKNRDSLPPCILGQCDQMWQDLGEKISVRQKKFIYSSQWYPALPGAFPTPTKNSKPTVKPQPSAKPEPAATSKHGQTTHGLGCMDPRTTFLGPLTREVGVPRPNQGSNPPWVGLHLPAKFIPKWPRDHGC